MTLFSSVPSQTKTSEDCKTKLTTTPEDHSVAPFKKVGNPTTDDDWPSIKPPNSVTVIGNGKPIKGFVPVVDRNGVKKVFN